MEAFLLIGQFEKFEGKECSARVSSRWWGGALRDDPKNGCVGDYHANDLSTISTLSKKSRVKEHAKAIATLDKNSLLAKHQMLNGHQIDLESAEIVDRSLAWRQRLILEAWHSVRNRNTINEHIALPNVYNNIKNF